MSMRMDMEETPEGEKLLPCPCGRDATMQPTYNRRDTTRQYWQPECRNCGRSGAFAQSKETATSLWNHDRAYNPEREGAAMAFVRDYVQNGCHHACTRAECSVRGQKRMARAEAILGK